MDAKPYTIHIPQAALDDMKDRLAHTRWVEEPATMGWNYGLPQDYLKELVDYWCTAFDWREQESELNQLPHFMTELDGQPIHFLHVRSQEPHALPLVLTHGWPSSFIQFLDVIGPLSNPRQHGGNPADAFHLVIPSVPGFGFSSPLKDVGWTLERTARAWADLMHGLGYSRYGAQGGDTGAFISPELGKIDPEHVVGVHVNAATYGFIPYGPVDAEEMATFSEAEQVRLARLAHYEENLSGYYYIQSKRPQTLAHALNDSPAGMLAWMMDIFKEFTNPTVALPEQSISRDRMLTNATLYWLTGTMGSSIRMYYEGAHAAGSYDEQPSMIPTGVAAFPTDVAIRRYAEMSYSIIHWSEFDRGGHFASLEAPDLLIEDVRAFFRPLRGA